MDELTQFCNDAASPLRKRDLTQELLYAPMIKASVRELIAEKGYSIGNIDSIVVAQKPKIGPYIPMMRQTLAEVLGIDADQVSVKATTTEHLGFEGREEGISAQAVVLLESSAV